MITYIFFICFFLLQLHVELIHAFQMNVQLGRKQKIFRLNVRQVISRTYIFHCKNFRAKNSRSSRLLCASFASFHLHECVNGISPFRFSTSYNNNNNIIVILQSRRSVNKNASWVGSSFSQIDASFGYRIISIVALVASSITGLFKRSRVLQCCRVCLEFIYYRVGTREMSEGYLQFSQLSTRSVQACFLP